MLDETQATRYVYEPSVKIRDAFAALGYMRHIRESIDRGEHISEPVYSLLTEALAECDAIRRAIK